MNRDIRVRRVLLIEGLANVFVLTLKVVVGVATGSLAVLGDAAHSLSDVANNVVAWFVLRLSAEPPDTEHPYGHRKFETLAVFALATLLTVVAVELALGAFRRPATTIESEPWLAADARHTFADIATTLVVIAGWQLAAHGYPWLDNLCALGVAILILFLAYGLFRRAIPILVDHAAIDSDTIRHLACSVEEVRDVGHIRSRSIGSQIAVDMVIRVAPDLTTAVSHAIADEVESRVLALPNVADVTVHVEPM